VEEIRWFLSESPETIDPVSRDQNQKRVLFLSNTFWYLFNFRSLLIAELLAQGQKIILAAGKDGYETRWDGQDVEVVKLYHLDRRGTSPLGDYRLWREIKAILASHRPHVTLSHTIKPNIYSCIGYDGRHGPIHCFVSGLGSAILQESWLTSVVRQLYRISLRNSHTIFCENLADQSYLKSLLPRHSDRILHIAGTGIDLDYYGSADFYDAPDGKVHLLFVGRLIRDKGVAELLEACKSLDPSTFHLHMVGEPDQDNPSALSEEYMAEELNQEYISHHGFVEDIRPILQKCHALVLPSYREGLSRSILEAMSVGRPILTSDVPGCTELVSPGENGFLFTPRSPEELASTIHNFINLDKMRMRSMGRKSRDIVETHYSSDSVNQKIISHINSTL